MELRIKGVKKEAALNQKAAVTGQNLEGNGR